MHESGYQYTGTGRDTEGNEEAPAGYQLEPGDP